MTLAHGCQAHPRMAILPPQPATSNIQLQELTLTKRPGDAISIGYSRNGQAAKATVTLAAQP